MRYIFVLLASMAFLCCKTSKHTITKTEAEQPTVTLDYKLDTTASVLKLAPEKGTKLYIDNIQIYLSAKVQPAVGVKTVSPAGQEQVRILPQVVNGDIYAIGGNVQLEILQGGYCQIDIYDGTSSKPLNARIVVLGRKKK
ncbi:MAG: hypothetical protein JST82_00630 [Bacteroidetes bacterium]|nr:hypothetical protein [Bacteroidota bacterium]